MSAALNRTLPCPDCVTETKTFPATKYQAPEREDKTIRAFKEQVLEHSKAKKPLVDVRSPDEYSGKKTHMPEYPQEGVLRGGHIPGAKSVPWARAINPEDGTFKTADELRKIGFEVGIPERDQTRNVDRAAH